MKKHLTDKSKWLDSLEPSPESGTKEPVQIPLKRISTGTYHEIIRKCYPVDDLRDNALAICEEAGEVAGAVKKLRRVTRTATSKRHVCEEMGDVLFHISQLAGTLGVDIEQLMYMSATKTLRWSGAAEGVPDKFTVRRMMSLPPGAYAVEADYSEMELRVLTSMVGKVPAKGYPVLVGKRLAPAFVVADSLEEAAEAMASRGYGVWEFQHRENAEIITKKEDPYVAGDRS